MARAEKFKAHLAQAAEVQLQLRIGVKNAGGLDGKRGNLPVRQAGNVLLLPGGALDIHRQDPPVGKNHPVPDGFIDANDLLIRQQQAPHRAADVVVVHLPQFGKGSVFKIKYFSEDEL